MKYFTIYFLIIFFFVSCRTLDIIFHPDDYIKRDEHPTITEIIYDTVKITNIEGNITTAVSGFPTKRITFTKIGQSYTFKNGETVEILLHEVDFTRATFDFETNLETKEVTIRLVDRDFSKVVLTSKCQIIKRIGAFSVPRIEVSPNLKPEQIVITPLFDNECRVNGFEIRYGSEERGCKDVAKRTLSDFRRCSDNEKKIPNQTPPPKSPCSYLRKLGLPCD